MIDRLIQPIVDAISVGGLYALTALGISPGVVHLNEGHSAFAALELVRLRMASEGISADVLLDVALPSRAPQVRPTLDRGLLELGVDGRDWRPLRQARRLRSLRPQASSRE